MVVVLISKNIMLMVRILLLSVFVSAACCVAGQAFPGTSSAATLAEGARLMFKNVKTKTLDAEKNFLFQKTGLHLAADKKGFMLEEFPVEVSVYPTDMNGDGKEEIFIVMYSPAMYGNVGTDFLLFIKNSAGAFVKQTDIGGGIPTILTAKSGGYNDILVGLPGMEFPVYKWNGTKYIRYKTIKDAAMKTVKTKDIKAFSEMYSAKL
jgi:hypothetical protein